MLVFRASSLLESQVNQPVNEERRHREPESLSGLEDGQGDRLRCLRSQEKRFTNPGSRRELKVNRNRRGGDGLLVGDARAHAAVLFLEPVIVDEMKREGVLRSRGRDSRGLWGRETASKGPS